MRILLWVHPSGYFYEPEVDPFLTLNLLQEPPCTESNPDV